MDRIRSIIALARRQLVIAALADAIAWGLVSASIVALLAVAFVKIGGDRLPAIAQQFKVSADDLRKWNKIGRLTAGQRLVIEVQQANPARSAKPAKNRRAAKKKK